MRHGNASPLTVLAWTLALVLVAGCASSSDAQREDDPDRNRAANSVSSEEVQENPKSSVQEMLQGRVAGVSVSEQGTGITVQIRGTTSVHGSGQPLYIVDGYPTTPGRGGYLDINPYDIKSIEVLKGSDAAFYGARAANGVIVVKTKRGRDR